MQHVMRKRMRERTIELTRRRRRMRLVAMLIVLRLVASEQSPVPSMILQQTLGINVAGCPMITTGHLGNPIRPSKTGLVARQLQFEARQSGLNVGQPQVKIYRFKTVCQTFPTRLNKHKTTVSLMVDYGCRGDGCRTPRSNKEYRLMHMYYFRCSGKQWDIYRQRGVGNVYRNHDYSKFQNVPNYNRRFICSICMNVQTPNDLIDVNARKNQRFQCLVCSETCVKSDYLFTGPGICAPSLVDTDTACCKYWYRGGCVLNCPPPHHFAFQMNPRRDYLPPEIKWRNHWKCVDKISLGLQYNTQRPFCPGSGKVTFRCHIYKPTNRDSQFWRVSFPGREPVTLSRRAQDSSIGARTTDRVVDTAFRFRYDLILTAVEGVSLGDAKITCSFEGYTGGKNTVELTGATYAIPLAAANFRVIAKERSSSTTTITLAWDPPPVPSEAYSHSLTLSIEPKAQSQPEANSPATVVLDNNMVYRINLTSENCAGINSTVIDVVTSLLGVTNLASGETSNKVINVLANHGDKGQEISCGYPNRPSNMTWEKERSISFPYQVSQIASADKLNQTLRWNRAMDLTDTGEYVCRSTQYEGVNPVKLRLAVKHPPTVASLYPRFPVYAETPKDILIPVGYVGTILTCNVYGSPHPTIEWTRNGKPIGPGRLRSTESHSFMYASSHLELHDIGFSEAIAGRYACVARGGNVVSSRLVQLKESSRKPTRIAASTSCSAQFFQLRFLEYGCGGSINKQHISRKVADIVRSAVGIKCQDCDVSSITIATVTCGRSVSDALFVIGTLSSTNATMRAKIFCAIRSWQEAGPLAEVKNGSFSLVDRKCPLKAGSTSSSECSFSSLLEAVGDLPLAASVICILLLVAVAVLSGAFVFLSVVIGKEESVDNVLKAPLFPNMDLKSYAAQAKYMVTNPKEFAASVKGAFKSRFKLPINLFKTPKSFFQRPFFKSGTEPTNVYADNYGEDWDVYGGEDFAETDSEYYDAVTEHM